MNYATVPSTHKHVTPNSVKSLISLNVAALWAVDCGRGA